MKNKRYRLTKQLKEAIKLNRIYERNETSPHQRDMARMRINILKRKVKELY